MVTLEQAYRALGLEPQEDKKKARRAYLKLLKKHKPESDPEGFQRIRAAWERIKNASEWEFSPAQNGHAVVSIDEPNAPPLNVVGETDINAVYHEAEGKTPAERLSIARKALDGEPANPDLRWFVYDCLVACDTPAQAVELLREWHPEDLGFFDQLILVHGDICTPEELAEAMERGVPAFQLMWVHIGRGEAEIAARLFREQFTRAQNDPLAMEHFDSVRLLLKLLALRPETREVAEEYVVWLRETGQERALDDYARAELALFKELLALPASFPATLRNALIDAVLAGDPSRATPTIAAWRSTHSGRKIRELKATMREHAPMLFSACWLSASAPKPKSGGGWFSNWWGLAGVVVLHLLFRMCNTATPPVDPQTMGILRRANEVREHQDRLQTNVVTRAQGIAHPPCDWFGADSDGCAQVRRIAEDAAQQRCDGINERLLDLERQFEVPTEPRDTAPPAHAIFVTLRVRLADDCPDLVDFRYLFEAQQPQPESPPTPTQEQEPQ